MKNASLLLSMSLLTLLSSCSLFEEKKDETVEPDKTITYGDTLVMKTGRGFSQVAILPWAFGTFSSGANGGFADGIEIADMSMLADGKSLQVATSSTLTTQQDPIYNILRYSIDINTLEKKSGPQSNLGEMVRTNFSSSGLGIMNRSRGYQPGGDKMYRSSLSVSNFGIWTVSITGDFAYTRSNTFAFTPRVCRNGEIVEDVLCETLPRIDGLVNQRIFTAYKNLNGTQQICQYYMPTSSPENTIRVAALEPKALNQNTAFLFGASNRFLYTIDLLFGGTTVPSVLTRLDSIPLPADYKPRQMETHVSEDGNTIGVLLSDQGTTPLFYSASYNRQSRTWTRNLNAVTIPGLGTSPNVDHDLDEAGNVYFDGWASNFQSDSTISIYKASSSGISSIAEDIIKSGSIKQIRYLNGKVYAAVVYSFSAKTGSSTKNYRVAVIKQD